nr:FMN-binding protein [Lachnospiraceae bacterium]
GKYVPGKYSAAADGMESYVLVEITVDENTITDVTVDVSDETQGIGDAIGEQMEKAILEAQSADVDTVTGATVSSEAVIKALSAALSDAAAVDGAEDEAAEEAVTEDEAAEEAVTENEAAGGTYTAGTYSASSAGISSDVKVEAEFDASSIKSVTIDVSGETAGIGAEIGDQMAEAILEAQSAEVDSVSGATITSDAVKKAMEDIIAQASGK